MGGGELLEVSLKRKKAPSPMWMTEAGNWSEVSSEE